MPYPLSAYAFRVLLNTMEFGFSKVSGLGRESGSVIYQEGGLNDRVHVLPGMVKGCGTVRLERGVYAGGYIPLYLAGERLAVPLRIEVCPPNDLRRQEKVYTLTGLVVRKWEVGELDAMQSMVLIDRFEVDYEHLDFSQA